MNKPDKDGWIEHVPGDCPVAPDTMLELQFIDGPTWVDRASNVYWSATERDAITRYRVLIPATPVAPTAPKAADALTARDQFAMAALTGVVSASKSFGDYAGIARDAYELADAMLKVRKGGAE